MNGSKPGRTRSSPVPFNTRTPPREVRDSSSQQAAREWECTGDDETVLFAARNTAFLQAARGILRYLIITYGQCPSNQLAAAKSEANCGT